MSNRHTGMNVIHSLYAHQAKIAEEYECFSCGVHKPYSQLNEKSWRGFDGPEIINVCDDCIRRGWEDWHRS